MVNHSVTLAYEGNCLVMIVIAVLIPPIARRRKFTHQLTAGNHRLLYDIISLLKRRVTITVIMNMLVYLLKGDMYSSSPVLSDAMDMMSPKRRCSLTDQLRNGSSDTSPNLSPITSPAKIDSQGEYVCIICHTCRQGCQVGDRNNMG